LVTAWLTIPELLGHDAVENDAADGGVTFPFRAVVEILVRQPFFLELRDAADLDAGVQVHGAGLVHRDDFPAGAE
jgi:hypothetical protein